MSLISRIAAKNQRIIRRGLSVYLDAGNRASYPGTGTAWTDLSGNNRNFNWHSTPSFTHGSIPYFNPLNNACVGPASNSFGIDNNSGYTIFITCSQISVQQSTAFHFFRDLSFNSVFWRGIFVHLTWDDDVVYLDQGGPCCGSDVRTNVASGGSQTWNVWTFRRFTNSSTRTISKNGNTIVTNTNTAASLDLDVRNCRIGVDGEGTSGNWNTKLGNFIVYNRGLSDLEIKQNFNAIRTRYGI